MVTGQKRYTFDLGPTPLRLIVVWWKASSLWHRGAGWHWFYSARGPANEELVGQAHGPFGTPEEARVDALKDYSIEPSSMAVPWPNEDWRYPPEHPLSREKNEAARRSGQQISKGRPPIDAGKLDAGDALGKAGLRDLLAWADNVIRAHRLAPQKAVERARLALAA